jgi:putative nucleotidyltransferase with HDIG domain
MSQKNNLSEDIIRKIDYFPQQAGASYQVLGLLEEVEATGDEFLKILEFDIPTTANILKLCNSPTYTEKFKIKGKISSLKEALDRISPDVLKEMISMTASSEIFARSSGSGYESGKGQIRRHSIASAVISKYLLPYAPQMKEDLFTTCLVHDIGKMILDESIGYHHDEIHQTMAEQHCDFATAETTILGMSHAEAGARILEKWQFPAEIIKAVRYHHRPDDMPNSPLTHFVSLANIIAMMMGFTTGLDAMEYKAFPQLYKKYKMKEKDIEFILMNSIDEVKNAIPFERRQDNSMWQGQDDKRKPENEKEKWW